MMKRGVYSRKREEWEERLLRFGKSGLTVAEFCEWEGVSPASYYNWRKRLGREQAPNRDASGVAPFMASRPESDIFLDRRSFVPIRMTSPAATLESSRVEIRLANGVCVFVPTADMGLVQRMISTVNGLTTGVDCESAARCLTERGELSEGVVC